MEKTYGMLQTAFRPSCMNRASVFEWHNIRILRKQKSQEGLSKKCLQLSVLLIGLVGRVFANGPGDLGSILGRVIPKTLKMVLDTSLLNTQKYKVYIQSKVEQSRERSSALPYTSV